LIGALLQPEEVKCRIEHYQTPSQVHVSVFAKKIVKEKSSVDFEAEQVRGFLPTSAGAH
jgi:hypothetical protein